MAKTISAPAVLISFVALLLFFIQARADESDFPIPANIRPAIEFWKKVYTEADTESGFLHDSQNLAIVYEKLDRDSKLIDQRRKQIIGDLKVLAAGKRTGLSAEQQSLLDLWGADVSNARLEQAADNIRWQLGQSDRYREGLVRSGAYRQHIENVALSKNMPVELAALPHVESSFHPGAYSSAAASGMWQFMRETAQRFMQVDAVVDERLDPYTASYAAMELLQSDYRALGSWPLALTAYNHGANGVARAVRETGSDDIGRIIGEYKGPRFGFASRNFYPQFLAVLEVERNAEQYFGKIDMHRQPDFAEFEMTAYVDIATVAATLGVGLDDLKHDNPALQPAVWNGNKRIPKGYKLKVDKAVFNGNLLASMNAIPAAQYFNSQIADLSYTVRNGDSLSVIASRYNTSISELVTINQLRNRNSIRVGQKLILPQQNGTIPTLVVSSNDTPQSVPASGEYEVRRGDTLTTISSRFKLAPATLLALNNLKNGNLIFPGQMLKLAPEAQAMAATTVNSQLQESLQGMDQVVAIDKVVEAVALTGSADAQAPLATRTVALASDTQVADPTDYGVAADNTIEILTDETLGHFADWLELGSANLRQLNQLRATAAVRVGDRLKLDFSKVDKAAFEAQRKQYHGSLQAQYFASYRIRDTENYSIKNSEVLGNLARARSIPMWLFRQYNPALGNTSLIKVGQVVVFPVVEKVTN